jgi:hypothetical protein
MLAFQGEQTRRFQSKYLNKDEEVYFWRRGAVLLIAGISTNETA